jgi:hypothetical protein
VASSKDYRYDPVGSPRDRSLRVGDKERDAVSDMLRQAHVEGRLDGEEFQTRLEQCLTARTYAELDRLIADIPREGADGSAARWRPGRRPVPFLFLPLAVIVAVALGGHLAWLAVPVLVFFVVRTLVWRSARVGPARGAWACGPGRTRRLL